MNRSAWSRDLACDLIGTEAARWKHTEAVARRAEDLGTRLHLSDDEVLEAAAWLHDIGYARDLIRTGCHHVDGAVYLEARNQHRLACLVAHHGSGQEEARLRGASAEIGQFAEEESLVADLLTYCDLSTGPDGAPLTLDERISEVTRRYGPDDVVTKGLQTARPRIQVCFERVEEAIARTRL